MQILAISGSLRAQSINSALLRAVARLAPADMQVRLFTELGQIPLFNPDLDPCAQPVVERLRQQLGAADLLLIASPEYAHGVTGVLKNALDWMVGNDALVHKPVVLLNASPRAIHAPAALREILQVMSAVIVEEASLCVPLLGTQWTEEAMVQQPEIAEPLRSALDRLREWMGRHSATAEDR